MLPPIALVTRLDREEEQAWLDVLSRALPEERIILFRDLAPADRLQAQVAIVANPDPSEVAALPGLAFIHSLWAGVERLVLELGASAPPIIRLVDPELARVMAEAVLAWTYYLQRDMPAYRRAQAAAEWAPRAYRHPGSMTIGLLGLGALGMAAATRLREAGFRVEGWSRSEKTVESMHTHHGDAGLSALLEGSDIVVCLLPLTSETRGLLNAERLARMQKGASLVNFARGAIVVADDLIAALDAGHLDHAVLDVFETEPLPSPSAFYAHPRVTVLPHISAPTTPATAAQIVAANVQAFRQTGQLPATVDMIRGY
jgi:glyoxylate/hydroxypyruvate reductase A